MKMQNFLKKKMLICILLLSMPRNLSQQLEESFTNEKVTFYKPLYVYTVCEPIGGVV